MCGKRLGIDSRYYIRQGVVRAHGNEIVLTVATEWLRGADLNTDVGHPALVWLESLVKPRDFEFYLS